MRRGFGAHGGGVKPADRMKAVARLRIIMHSLPDVALSKLLDFAERLFLENPPAVAFERREAQRRSDADELPEGWSKPIQRGEGQ